MRKIKKVSFVIVLIICFLVIQGCYTQLVTSRKVVIIEERTYKSPEFIEYSTSNDIADSDSLYSDSLDYYGEDDYYTIDDEDGTDITVYRNGFKLNPDKITVIEKNYYVDDYDDYWDDYYSPYHSPRYRFYFSYSWGNPYHWRPYYNPYGWSCYNAGWDPWYASFYDPFDYFNPWFNNGYHTTYYYNHHFNNWGNSWGNTAWFKHDKKKRDWDKRGSELVNRTVKRTRSGTTHKDKQDEIKNDNAKKRSSDRTIVRRKPVRSEDKRNTAAKNRKRSERSKRDIVNRKTPSRNKDSLKNRSINSRYRILNRETTNKNVNAPDRDSRSNNKRLRTNSKRDLYRFAQNSKRELKSRKRLNNNEI